MIFRWSTTTRKCSISWRRFQTRITATRIDAVVLKRNRLGGRKSMKGVAKAGIVRRTHTTTALAAAVFLAVAFSMPLFASAQHHNAPRPALGSRGGNLHAQPNRSEMRPQVQSRPRAFGNAVQSAPQY